MKEIELCMEKLDKTEEIFASYLIRDLRELLEDADESKIEDGDRRYKIWSILQHFGPMMGLGTLTSIEQITELHDVVRKLRSCLCGYDVVLNDILDDIAEQEKMLLFIDNAITLMGEK